MGITADNGHLEATAVHRWVTSAGDARVYIVPAAAATGHTAALKHTSTATGRVHVINLSMSELRAIARDAQAILDADNDTREQWIGQAAAAIDKRLKATAK